MSYLNRVDSAEKAIEFLKSLHEHGLLYHPEESAAACLAQHGIVRTYLAQIDRNMKRCFNFLQDPCDTALKIINGDHVS